MITPPTLLILSIAWMGLNVTLNVYNKWLFRVAHFDYPLALIAAQQILTFCALSLFAIFGSRPQSLNRGAILRVALLGLLFGLNTILNLESLVRVSLTFNQCVRSYLPIATMIASHFIERKRFERPMILNAIGISIGVMLSVTENPTYDQIGFLLVVGSVLASAAQNALSGHLLQGMGLELKPWELVFYQSLPLFLVTLLLSTTYETPHHHHLNPMVHPNAVTFLMGSAVLALLYNTLRFTVIQRTSSVFLSVLGNFKMVIVILIDVLCFHTHLRILNLVGITITIVCFFIHTALHVQKQLEGAQQRALAHAMEERDEWEHELKDLQFKRTRSSDSLIPKRNHSNSHPTTPCPPNLV